MSANGTGEAVLSSGAGIPVGPCPSCEREVVVYVVERASDSEGELYACVHCDGPVGGFSLVEESALTELGYDVSDPLAAGCGTGCAAGGCAGKPKTIDELLAAYRRL